MGKTNTILMYFKIVPVITYNSSLEGCSRNSSVVINPLGSPADNNLSHPLYEVLFVTHASNSSSTLQKATSTNSGNTKSSFDFGI